MYLKSIALKGPKESNRMWLLVRLWEIRRHVLLKIHYVLSTKHYEPSSIQYIPVCQHVFELIKEDLSEENSELTTIKTGETTVTLHSKQYGHQWNHGDVI